MATATATPASAGPKEQNLVNEAASTLNGFLIDPDYGALKDILSRARGIMIVPDFIKAGLVVGGQSGDLDEFRTLMKRLRIGRARGLRSACAT